MIKHLYRFSYEGAVDLEEVDMWLESHKENVRCKQSIEEMIREGFDGKTLRSDIAKDLCQEYGIERVKRVLATTIQENINDGRYRPENKDWAQSVRVPNDKQNQELCVDSHPELINGLVNQYKRYLRQDLGLLDSSDCLKFDSPQNYTNRLLILRSSVLVDEYKQGKYQYFFARDGFGCDPSATGNSVFGEFLCDGEVANFHRAQFIGIADESKLPEWAYERLQEIMDNIDEDESEVQSF